MRSKVHIQHIVGQMLEQYGAISALEVHQALGLRNLSRTQDAVRQAVKRMRLAGWNIRTRPRCDGGGYELTSSPRTGIAR